MNGMLVFVCAVFALCMTRGRMVASKVASFSEQINFELNCTIAGSSLSEFTSCMLSYFHHLGMLYSSRSAHGMYILYLVCPANPWRHTSFSAAPLVHRISGDMPIRMFRWRLREGVVGGWVFVRGSAGSRCVQRESAAGIRSLPGRSGCANGRLQQISSGNTDLWKKACG